MADNAIVTKEWLEETFPEARIEYTDDGKAYVHAGGGYPLMYSITMTTERMDSSTIIDKVFNTNGGPEAFLKMARKILKAEIAFDEKDCDYIVTWRP